MDIAPPEAIEGSLEQIQQILVAASSGHCVTGLETQIMEGPLYTLIDTEAEVMPSFPAPSTKYILLAFSYYQAQQSFPLLTFVFRSAALT